MQALYCKRSCKIHYKELQLTVRLNLMFLAVVQDLGVSDVSDVSDLELSDNEAVKAKPSSVSGAGDVMSSKKVPLSARSVSVKVIDLLRLIAATFR